MITGDDGRQYASREEEADTLRLEAVAPEMLEELKDALTILEAHHLEPKHRKSMAAVIAKAEGRQ